MNLEWGILQEYMFPNVVIVIQKLYMDSCPRSKDLSANLFFFLLFSIS
jgi:hypothetical protein